MAEPERIAIGHDGPVVRSDRRGGQPFTLGAHRVRSASAPQPAIARRLRSPNASFQRNRPASVGCAARIRAALDRAVGRLLRVRIRVIGAFGMSGVLALVGLLYSLRSTE